jgi:hypothetical protein
LSLVLHIAVVPLQPISSSPAASRQVAQVFAPALHTGVAPPQPTSVASPAWVSKQPTHAPRPPFAVALHSAAAPPQP